MYAVFSLIGLAFFVGLRLLRPGTL